MPQMPLSRQVNAICLWCLLSSSTIFSLVPAAPAAEIDVVDSFVAEAAEVGLEDSDARHLAEIGVDEKFPSTLQVAIGERKVAGVGESLEVLAGVNYSGLTVVAPGNTFASVASGVAKLRLVVQGTEPRYGGCASADSYRAGGNNGFTDEAIPVVVKAEGISSLGPLTFMLGGNYQLCYSHDGSFSASSSQILNVPTSLDVRGARLKCDTDGCLEDYRWKCFVYSDEPTPQGSCVVKFGAVVQVANPQLARLSWGSTVYFRPGSTEPIGWRCGGSTPSTRIISGYLPPLLGTLGREFSPQARAFGSDTRGFSVQACYCAQLDGEDSNSEACDADAEFEQPVGRVYFYYTKACDDGTCTNEYTLVNPVSPFALHVECAGALACSETNSNRLKVIDDGILGANDRPFWAENTGCRVAAQSPSYLRPENCAPDAAASCGGSGGEMNGGTKADVKVFEGLAMSPTYVSGVSMTKLYDVCYCDSDCDAASAPDAADRFHKVGRIRITPLRMVGVDQTGQTTGISMVGVVGDVMVDGRGNVPIVPRPAQMKLLWDNLRKKTSADCANNLDLAEFAPGFGPSCSTTNQCSYKAALTGIDPGLMLTGRGTVVTFNDGGTRGQRLRFSEVGIVAICYCGVLSDGTGAQGAGDCMSAANDFSYWTLMVRTLIRGPCLPGENMQCKEQEWQFYTGIVFRLQVFGMGLKSTDKLRIIPANDKCRDNRDGGGEPTVMKNCPGACSPLSLSDTYLYGGGEGKDDIDVQITTSNTVDCDVQNANCKKVKAVEITTHFDYSVWRFERDPLFNDGDTVILDNVTGGTAEENEMMAGQIGLEHIGWPVTRLKDTSFRVDGHLPPGNIPKFKPGGSWHRHNVLYTREELKGTAPKSQLQLCWGSGPDAYHARAGVISFISPASMPEAMTSLSGVEEGKQSPAVVSFRTASGGVAGMRYKTAVNSMRLNLAFEEVSKLEPLLADADAQPIPITAPTDADELPEAKQSLCGRIFLELWSDDSKGFPMPRGCYYGSLMDNRRELHVVFEPKNGLEAGGNYQMVLNLRAAAGASSADNLLSVWSMDDAVEMPYSAVELGDARLSRNPKPASGIGEPRLMSSGGLTLLDEDGGFKNLIELTSDPVSLLFRVQGDGRSRIVAGTYLRIFLRPLTVWNLRELCQAKCFPHRTLVCGTISLCRAEAVVEKGQRNIIRLQLPQTMTEIYGATVQHTVRVSELSLPERGFFGTRIGAQVSTEGDSRVHYSETSGAFIWKAPSANNPQTSVASIVTQGDGNDRPFRDDVGNTLYVRVILGASLLSELHDGDASFTITLPLGYLCDAVDPVPSTLLAFGEQWPQGRGSLKASHGGSWHLDRHKCKYSLDATQMIPAGSHLYIKVTVGQPSFPLQKTDVLNRWSLQLSSKGWYRQSSQVVPPVNFVGSELCTSSCEFSTNVAVLGKLSVCNLQPRSFKAGDEDNMLQIFFRPEQRSGYRGLVMVVGPIGFNFATALPDRCQPSRLPEEYYRTVGSDEPTRYLPIVESCISDCSAVWSCPDATYNRANIRIQNSLEPKFVYGFRIFVINTATHKAGDVSSWRIITADSLEHHLDASYPTAQLNPAIGGTSRAWGVYLSRGRELSMGLVFSSLLPFAFTGTLASLTIFPIEVELTILSTCRLILPAGYETTPNDFLYHFSKVEGATASWPGQIPWQSQQRNPGRSNPYGDQAKNVLLWDEAKYSPREKYGFTTKVLIPRQPSTTTSQWLILQFGWDSDALVDRSLAYVVPLPQIRAITDLRVRYRTNVFSLLNFLMISLETSMPIAPGGELRIHAPVGFIFEERCTAETVPGEEPLPIRVTCSAAAKLERDGTNVGTLIRLSPAMEVLVAARYAIGLKVRNPSMPQTNRGGQDTDCGHEQCWRAESVDSSGQILDTTSTTPGFAVNRQMLEAKLLDLNGWQRLSTNRNDRPGSPNNLIFAFRLSERPSSVGKLVLSGPWGFVFDEDCLPGLRIEDTKLGDRGVFGTLNWMLRYTRWEEAAKVRSCSGDGSVATMYVELGLRANELYAFRIHIASNPTIAPKPNSWTIEYAAESCAPFEGFTLWTFSEYQLLFTIAAASMSSLRVPNPVTLRFRPHKQVNADPLGQGTGGLLRITAPAGFILVTLGALGQSCSDYVLREGQNYFEPAVDILCGVQEDAANAVRFTLIGSKKIEAGKLYELVVQYYNPRTVTSVSVPWVASTFSDSSGAMDAALDSTTIEGYPINTPMFRWTVAKPSGEQHAGAVVEDVAIEMAFPVPLTPRSEILITAPSAFDLSAPRQCEPQIGSVLGGIREHVGFSRSLMECAQLVWDVSPKSEAAAWNTEDNRCFAYIGKVSLDICGPVSLPEANSSLSVRRVQASDKKESSECNRYIFHVCSFASLNRACNQFAFRGDNRLKLEPSCEMNTMAFRVSEDEEVPPTTSIAFVVTTRNPPRNPALVDSFWIARQFSPETTLLSSWSTASWAVIPVLFDCTVRLTGMLQASGSLSELTVTFVPTSDADEIELSALAPYGFDFTDTVVAGAETSLKTADQTFVVLRRMLTGGHVLDPPVILGNVRLPAPGNVEFRIVTYLEGFKADEILLVSGASTFDVPGTIEVLDQQLETVHVLTSDVHPYRAGFKPRAGDAAIATFKLRFGAAPLAGEKLTITGLPFRFQEGALKKFMQLSDTGSETKAVGAQGTALNDGAIFSITLLDALETGATYALQFETLTGPSVVNGEKWSFETRRTDVLLPTNTNDGQTSGFELVDTILLTISVGRVAPRSDAALELVIDPQAARPTILRVYAPKGFSFPTGSCLQQGPGADSKILSCRRGDSSKIAELQLQGSGLQVAARTIIVVRAPDKQDLTLGNTWLIEAQAGVQELQVGWGEASGFKVVEMDEARLIYGGAPSFRTHMAATFRTSQSLFGGGRIDVLAPEVYKLSCRETQGFSAISVKGIQSCDDAGIGRLSLTLNETMATGDYAFMFGATNPYITPAQNLFSILLLDTSGNVVDARMLFQGQRIVQGLFVRPPSLEWSSSMPLTRARVQISLVVSTALDPQNAIGATRALQIGVPERFSLITNRPVENVDGLETPEAGWFHMYYIERLVRIDVVKSDQEMPRIIPQGIYRFAFYVRLPEFWMPNVNVWLLSLCRDLRCTDLIATLPAAGFNFGDEPTLADPEAIKKEKGVANRQHSGPGTFGHSLLVLIVSWTLMARLRMVL